VVRRGKIAGAQHEPLENQILRPLQKLAKGKPTSGQPPRRQRSGPRLQQVHLWTLAATVYCWSAPLRVRELRLGYRGSTSCANSKAKLTSQSQAARATSACSSISRRACLTGWSRRTFREEIFAALRVFSLMDRPRASPAPRANASSGRPRCRQLLPGGEPQRVAAPLAARVGNHFCFVAHIRISLIEWSWRGNLSHIPVRS
jgi:hypothetical protein